MYKVLYQPELAQAVPGCATGAYAAIVYDGPHGRLRPLIVSTARGLEGQLEHVTMFETAAKMLNDGSSLSVQNQRLRSIRIYWQRAEAAAWRAAALARRPRADFGADFGRMDVGERVGSFSSVGRVDGYW